MKKKRKQTFVYSGLVVAAIVLFAFVLRSYDITSYPPGLFPDEAANGEDAISILHGDLKPFYPRGNGREALFFYLQAALIKTFGIGPWQMHAASVIVGTLTVIAMYFAARIYFGKLAGILSALFLATSSWHLTLSRTGFRAIQAPLFICLFTAFVGYTIHSVKKKRWRASYVYAALAGASFAGGFYTYIAYRAMVAVVLGVVVLLLLAAIHPKIGFPHAKRYGKHILIGIITTCIVLSPLVLYFVWHKDEFVGRAGQVSIFSPSLQREVGGGTLAGTFLYSFNTTALSFFQHGDLNWRHNVSGYPLLNPLVGFLFVLGICWMIKGTYDVARKIIKGKEVHMGMVYPYLLLLLIGMMVPVVTTAEGMPHALRSIGMAAPIFIIAGTAGAVVVRFASRWGSKRNVLGIVYGVLVGLLLLSSVYGPWLYFMISKNSPEAARAYRGDLTVVSKYLKDFSASHPNDPKPYLILDAFSQQTPHFLAGGDTYRPIDPGNTSLPFVKNGEKIIFTESTIPDADRYEQYYRNDIKLIDSSLNRFGKEDMRIYEGVNTAPADREFDLDA